MKIIQYFLLIFIVFFSSCSKKLVPTILKNKELSSSLSSHDKETMRDLNKIVESIVHAGGNIKRGKTIVEITKKFNLTKQTSIENIDWLSFQKNILVEIKGKTPKIVYIVSHYDKTDVNPFTIPNILINGALDPLMSWAYVSDGALDNATGVAVSLKLAKELAKWNMKYTYRILLVGSEESGLRGSRAHVARMPDSISKNLIYMINTDVIGVKNKSNCVSTDVSNSILSELSLEVAKELDIELGIGSIPALSCSDYASFKKTDFLTDFGRSLQFNLVGAFLPQRSYFTKKKETEVINFTSCDVLDAGDYAGALLFMPIGSIHGFRDSIKLVDERKLLEHYLLTLNLIKKVETLDQTEIISFSK